MLEVINKYFIVCDDVLTDLTALGKRQKSLTIPDCVRRCQKHVFYGNEILTNIELSKKMTQIREEEFAFCKNLTKISIPKNITKIGMAAFIGCEKLTSIKMHEGVQLIDCYAFQDCLSLTDVKLSNNLTEIRSFAFSNCSKLANMEIPDSLEFIETDAFYNSPLQKNTDFVRQVQAIQFLDDKFYNHRDLIDETEFVYAVYERIAKNSHYKIEKSTNAEERTKILNECVNKIAQIDYSFYYVNRKKWSEKMMKDEAKDNINYLLKNFMERDDNKIESIVGNPHPKFIEETEQE